jgi:hypothetical protein
MAHYEGTVRVTDETAAGQVISGRGALFRSKDRYLDNPTAYFGIAALNGSLTFGTSAISTLTR